METVLLADDERLFKAVEGTSLRRERCRLLMASADRLSPTAAKTHPDLIITTTDDAPSRARLTTRLARKSLSWIPILVVAFGSKTQAAPVPKRGQGAGPLVRIPGRVARLDSRRDAAIKQLLPILDRASDRVAVSLPVRCEGGRTTFTLKTKNLSPTGLFLKTERVLSAGQRLTVRFSLPPTVAPRKKDAAPRAIRCECEVVRLVGVGGRTGEDDDLIPGVGVRFISMQNDARTTLKRFVRVAAQQPAAN